MDIVSTLYGRQERSWQVQANCMGVDPDLFFPERGASTREAKEVCRGCVVREDCLEYALANGEKFGIWGGMSERERRRLRRARPCPAATSSARRPTAAPPRPFGPEPAENLTAKNYHGATVEPRLDAGLGGQPEFGPARRRDRLQEGAGEQAHQLASVHGATGTGDQAGHGVVELGRSQGAGSIRLHDTWARSPTRSPRARTRGPLIWPATNRATSTGETQTL